MSNCGVFGSPERHLIFDLNDFDETAPGPWEWDVKRLGASIEIAGRENDYSGKVRQRIVRHAVRSYRETMQELASVPMMSVWYAHLNVEAILPRFRALLQPKKTPNVWKAITKARAHDSHQAFRKLCYDQDGETKIIHDPPLIVPVEHFTTGVDPRVTTDALTEMPSRENAARPPTVEPVSCPLVASMRDCTAAPIAARHDQTDGVAGQLGGDHGDQALVRRARRCNANVQVK